MAVCAFWCHAQRIKKAPVGLPRCRVYICTCNIVFTSVWRVVSPASSAPCPRNAPHFPPCDQEEKATACERVRSVRFGTLASFSNSVCRSIAMRALQTGLRPPGSSTAGCRHSSLTQPGGMAAAVPNRHITRQLSSCTFQATKKVLVGAGALDATDIACRSSSQRPGITTHTDWAAHLSRRHHCCSSSGGATSFRYGSTAAAAAPHSSTAQPDIEVMRSQLQLHNTLSKCKEAFRPRPNMGDTVQMYVCGVTVYDLSHIGMNALFIPQLHAHACLIVQARVRAACRHPVLHPPQHS